jgi:hypothetical protein
MARRAISMTKLIKIKKNDTVKVSSSGKIGIITSIQYEFNRYQLMRVSGWQYGIDELSVVTVESLITTIETQKQAWDDAEMRAADAISERNDLQKQIESLQKENERLKHEVIDFTRSRRDLPR